MDQWEQQQCDTHNTTYASKKWMIKLELIADKSQMEIVFWAGFYFSRGFVIRKSKLQPLYAIKVRYQNGLNLLIPTIRWAGCYNNLADTAPKEVTTSFSRNFPFYDDLCKSFLTQLRNVKTDATFPCKNRRVSFPQKDWSANLLLISQVMLSSQFAFYQPSKDLQL